MRLLVQPLLDLKASPECPKILESHKCRKAVKVDKCLTGKHFSYKVAQRERCCVRSKKKSPAGKKLDKKTKNFCPKCKVHLCVGACFEDFHTKSQY